MDNNPKRKLSAIVFTDIIVFTELLAKNEPAALDLLIKQRETLKPIVEAKRQLDSVLDIIKPDKVEKVSSYSMFQKILESYNKMENS